MNFKTFMKAKDLLKASGASFESITTPFYSEEQGGIVIPTIGKVLQLENLSPKEVSWHEAMRLAEEAGMELPTKEELQHIRIYKPILDKIIKEQGGDPLEGLFWSCTEFSQSIAWFINFSSGGAYGNYECGTSYCRAVAAFK